MSKNFYWVKPFEWQTVVHNAITAAGPKANKIFVVKSPRQIGKSMIIQGELLRHSINYPKSVNICLSITYSNCRKIYNDITAGIRDWDFVKKINDSAMEITFKNGSAIIFKSSVVREALRGYTIKNNGILCIDEGAYIPDDIYSIVFPWTNVYKANILIVSTPRLKSGVFYEYYTEGLKDNPSIESFDLSKFDTSIMLSQDKIELYRKLMPPAQFTSEILGEFTDKSESVFDISGNIWWKNGAAPSLISNKDEYSELFIGIDWGSGNTGDYTVISGFDAKGTQHLLSYFNNKTPEQQLLYIQELILYKLDTKKIKIILAETNSIGNIYLDRLKSMLPNIKIEGFTTTNDSKREIIEYLISRVNTEDIKLINNKEQYTEMSAYVMEITKTGKITYNGIGQHDDIVMANAIAFKAIKDKQKTGNYNISFTNKKIQTRKYD